MKREENYYPVHDVSGLTDWGGDHVSRKILTNLQDGNIVRIRIKDKNCYYLSSSYVRIKKAIRDGKITKYKAIFEDPYWREWYETSWNLGDKVMFCQKDVIEIPFDWKGNKNLKKIKNKYIMIK